jgi:hypothetical protein
MKLVLLAAIALVATTVPLATAVDPLPDCVRGPCLPPAPPVPNPKEIDVPELPHVDCIQVVPWSYLCSGNVGAFVCYYVHCDGISRDAFLP